MNSYGFTARVITYRLAYLDREVSLCDACLERDDHECGSIGPVQHGQHDGECDGSNHEPQAAYDAPGRPKRESGT